MSRIIYSTTTIFGKITAETINELLTVHGKLTRLQTTMNEVIGDPPDYTLLEAGDFGVSTNSGEAFYTLIDAILVALNNHPANRLDMGG